MGSGWRRLVCVALLAGCAAFQPARPAARALGVSRPEVCETALLAKKKPENAPVVVARAPRERKVQEGKIEVDGVVKEALPNAMFRVEISVTNSLLLCTISGKIRKNFVKILVGDSVKVELSAYDLTRGRITFRERK
ncbi:hypothetical protein M885DRAFT_510787 [Pelagophyceae sp. CCMP2097]|nr:hypothetical protein M885DRAFT_510787 [Pelagophyceae sp. CCMP2097]|mmetsp:Transcript_11007/g.36783  ORF Transcript_11007/g.36783 Transcript_11007/m.36783 type:complete len:137 (+) Transcript_11007:51-461(+)